MAEVRFRDVQLLSFSLYLPKLCISSIYGLDDHYSSIFPCWLQSRMKPARSKSPRMSWKTLWHPYSQTCALRWTSTNSGAPLPVKAHRAIFMIDLSEHATTCWTLSKVQSSSLKLRILKRTTIWTFTYRLWLLVRTWGATTIRSRGRTFTLAK